MQASVHEIKNVMPGDVSAGGGGCHIIQKLCALYGDSDARDFVLTSPELGHLLIKPLKLGGEFFSRNDLLITILSLLLKLVHSVFALAHLDSFLDALAFSIIENDVLRVCDLFEHREYLQLLLLPSLKVLV